MDFGKLTFMLIIAWQNVSVSVLNESGQNLKTYKKGNIYLKAKNADGEISSI